ncbi:MAG: methylated-DNA--[protein]-cysteine S-methyltransferase [Alphaproteobacteria bacterium]|nr:methylated-DNA--[protein]-cysteine S-methyltransferase [Alphaproteobacteria bacterium]
MTAAPGNIRHCLFDTAFGPCGVAWSARGLVALQLPERDRTETERRLAAKASSNGAGDPPPAIAASIAQVRDYLSGTRADFSPAPVDLAGIDAFRGKVYAALRGVDFGHTVTYGELARQAGVSDWEGARDVGDAMARNPLPVVIPCHRVLAANGKLGGFSAHGGTATKLKLLALEGVHFDSGAPRLPGL